MVSSLARLHINVVQNAVDALAILTCCNYSLQSRAIVVTTGPWRLGSGAAQHILSGSASFGRSDGRRRNIEVVGAEVRL